jgi:hypothetical protein
MFRIALTAMLILAIPTGALADTKLFLIVSGVAPVSIATFTNSAQLGQSITQCNNAIAAARHSTAQVAGAAVNVTLVCISTN